MSIWFAAIHERNSWRKHNKHTSLASAVTGRDGAENLLRQRGRSRERIAENGVAHAVFVWADDQTDAMALRLKPGSHDEIERVSMQVGALLDFGQDSGPSLTQVAEWFTAAHSGHTSELGEIPKILKGSVQEPSRQLPERQYRYGSKATWEIAYEAVRAYGRPVSLVKLSESISAELPNFKLSNLAPDLSMLSVNCMSRGNHAVNHIPRRTDSGNVYDKLIRIGNGRDVRFTLYDSQVHGVWELVDVGHKVLRPHHLGTSDPAELEQAREAALEARVFDPAEDARQRTLAAIVRREGQPAFRRSLLAAYGGACAISGCNVEALLEAAHIVPYRGAQTNIIGNGLLLRADLHKLFDLHLLGIDPVTRRVYLSEALRKSEYSVFHGVELRAPSDSRHIARTELLAYHQERCGWMSVA